MTGLTERQLEEIENRALLAYDGGDPIQTTGYDVPALVAEIRRLRALANPATWTAPDGTVLDLTRQVFDRDGDAWTLVKVPPLTVAMVDGDASDSTLPELFERYGPLTNEGEEL